MSSPEISQEKTNTGKSSVRSLFIPIQDGYLLVPRACVIEIIPLKRLQTAETEAPDWLLGNINWHQQQIPVIDFSAANSGTSAKRIHRQKICILAIHQARDGCPSHYALLCERLPQPLLLQEEIISFSEKTDDSPLIQHRIGIGNRRAFVPDLEAVEILLSQYGKWQE